MVDPVPFDPLLVLLRKHEAANSAYDAAAATDASDAMRQGLFAECSATMQEILDRSPNAATAEGAIAALDHVLNEEALWRDSEQYAGERFLRLLIQAARNYIARRAK